MFVPETQVDAHERSDDDMSIDEYPRRNYPVYRSRSWIPTVATRARTALGCCVRRPRGRVGEIRVAACVFRSRSNELVKSLCASILKAPGGATRRFRRSKSMRFTRVIVVKIQALNSSIACMGNRTRRYAERAEGAILVHRAWETAENGQGLRDV